MFISKIKISIAPSLFLGIVLGTWELVVRSANIPVYLVPAPSTILITVVTNGASLIRHAGFTMLEALLGFLLANILGFGLAIVFVHSKIAERAIIPYAIALKTTPIIAMAPLLVLWCGTGLVSKVVAAALVCFFPILVNATKGLRNIEDTSLDLFKSLSASRWQVFRLLRLPGSLPYLFSALKISTSLSIVGAIVGEFVGANAGLGYVILVSSYHLETPMMFAAIFIAAIGGILLFSVVSLLERRLLYWQKPIE